MNNAQGPFSYGAEVDWSDYKFLLADRERDRAEEREQKEGRGRAQVPDSDRMPQEDLAF